MYQPFISINILYVSCVIRWKTVIEIIERLQRDTLVGGTGVQSPESPTRWGCSQLLTPMPMLLSVAQQYHSTTPFTIIHHRSDQIIDIQDLEKKIKWLAYKVKEKHLTT